MGPPPKPSSGAGLSGRVMSGFFWTMSGNGVQAVLKVLVTIVLARLLSPTDFGVVGAATIVVSLAQIVSQMGIGPAIVQKAELTDRDLRTGLLLSIAMGLLLGAMVYLSAPLVAAFFRMTNLGSLVQAMSIMFPILGLGVVAESLLQRDLRFRITALTDVVSFALGYGAVGIALAYAGWGPWALVVAQLVQTTIRVAIVNVLNRRARGPGFNMASARALLWFGTGFSIARFSNFMAQQLDNVVVGRWMGAEALGLYGRAYQFLMLPANLIGASADRVLFPVMATVQDDTARLRRGFVRGSNLAALATLPLSGFLIVAAPELVIVLLGQDWAAVAGPFRILALILVLRVSYKLSDSVARATGAVYRRAWRQCLYAAAVFGGAWMGHFWGLEGVAWGVAGAVALNYLLMFHLTARLIGVSWTAVSAIHLRYTLVAAVVASLTWVGFEAGRLAGFSDVTRLIFGAAMACLVLFGIWFWRGRVLDHEAAEALDLMVLLIRKKGQTP